MNECNKNAAVPHLRQRVGRAASSFLSSKWQNCPEISTLHKQLGHTCFTSCTLQLYHGVLLHCCTIATVLLYDCALLYCCTVDVRLLYGAVRCCTAAVRLPARAHRPVLMYVLYVLYGAVLLYGCCTMYVMYCCTARAPTSRSQKRWRPHAAPPRYRRAQR